MQRSINRSPTAATPRRVLRVACGRRSTPPCRLRSPRLAEGIKELAIAGLGRMGGNMARRLHNAGISVVAYNRSRDKTEEIIGEGLTGGFTPDEVVAMLTPP